MRVAAAVIRGLEALAGAAVGLIPVLGAFALVRAAIAVGVSVSEAGYTPFIFLSVGFGAATVAFCALGAAGAGFAMRRGLRTGA